VIAFQRDRGPARRRRRSRTEHLGPGTWARVAHRAQRRYALQLARQYGSTVRAIEFESDADPMPFASQYALHSAGFPVFPRTRFAARRILVRTGLAARYPFVNFGQILQRLWKTFVLAVFGGGNRLVFYNAAHHANE
jgi:hypothetical protein